MTPLRSPALVLGVLALAGLGLFFYFRPPPGDSIAIAKVAPPAIAPASSVPTAPLPPAPAPALPAPTSASAAAVPPTPRSFREIEAEKIATLRDILTRLPEQNIPELKLLTERDWRSAVVEIDLETPQGVRSTLGRLRAEAAKRFVQAVSPALRDYIKANGGNFPTDPIQLQPFVPTAIEPAMLQRYRVAQAIEVPVIETKSSWIITQATIVDSDHDATVALAADVAMVSVTPPIVLRELAILDPARKAYRAAHGNYPLEPDLLIPYANTPEQHAAIQSLKKAREKANAATR